MPSSSPKASPAKATAKPRKRKARLIPLRTPRLEPARADEFEASVHRAVSAAFDELFELDKAIEACHAMMESIWCGRKGHVGIDWVPERSRKGKFAAAGTRPLVFRADGSVRRLAAGMRVRRAYMVTELPIEDLQLRLVKLEPWLRHNEVKTLREVLSALRGLLQRREVIRAWLGGILTWSNLNRRPEKGGAAATNSLFMRLPTLETTAMLTVKLMAPVLPKV